MTPEAKADILRSFIEQARAALEGAMNPLNPVQPDWHARMSAGAKLLVLIEANPPKTASTESRGAQVVIVNEMPAWAREPKAVQARVIDAAPALGQGEPGSGDSQK